MLVENDPSFSDDPRHPTASGITGTDKPRERIRLFLASFLGLFIELAFIRFIPAHVQVVGYYTNLVLIASFLGLGLGFLVSHSNFRLERFLLPLLLVTVIVVRLFANVVVLNPGDTDEPLWLFFYEATEQLTEMSIGPVVLIHFLLVSLTLMPVGQVMGRLFVRLPRLKAYALDLGGSLFGVVFFGMLSSFCTPPIIWFGLSTIIIVSALCHGLRERAYSAFFGILLLSFVWSMDNGRQIWSPYYMVEVLRENPKQQVVLTNGTLHQVMLDFESDSEYVRKTKEGFEIPYRMSRSLENVLIVGAGTGNDIAIAQAMGAKHIDAVEIDEVFTELGRQYHPLSPYQGKNVTVHVTDARAFFRRCENRYDLIVFGTLDSQALLGHLSSIRLDNYVYTIEAFQDAYRLLKPGGLLSVFHMSLTSYIGDRIYLLLTAVAGRPPLRLYFKDHTLFNNLFVQGEGVPIYEPSKEDLVRLTRIKIPEDDWPFLYLKRPTIPWHYGQVLIGVILIAFLGSTIAMKGQLGKLDLRLFLLGAGFLLLETKSVTQMSLLFGSTWVVNMLVFSSILAVLLGANAYVIRWEHKNRLVSLHHLFWGLCLVLVVIVFIPISWIAGQHEVVQWLLGGTLVALPIGLAGLIFPLLFKEVDDPRAGFASNLMGAIIGGAAEYCTMWLGIRYLTLVAALFYLVTFALYVRRVK